MVRGVELFFSLFNNLAIFIALVTVYGYLINQFRKSIWFRRQTIVGLSFGIFAIGCMYAKIPVFEGVIVDQRNAIVALSGAFGGPLSAIISAILTGSYRIYLGGDGVLAGTIGVGLSAIAGIVLNKVPGCYSSMWKAAKSTFFAVILILPGFLFIKDFQTGWNLLKAMALPYGLAIYCGIYLVGLLLNREEERYNLELSFRESEEKYRELIEGTEDLITHTDKNGDFTFINHVAEKILGITPKEGIGMSAFQFIHPDDLAMTEEWFNRAIKQKAGQKKIENRQVNSKTGEVRTVSWSSSFHYTKSGSLLGIGNIARDITEQKRAEEELKRLQNLLTNIINSMPSVLVGVDSEGKVIQWNREAEKMTGVLFKQASGRLLSDIFPPMADKMKNLFEAIRTKQTKREVKVATRVEGKMHYSDVTIYPLITNGVEGAVIRIDDVSEHVKLEEMMVQSEKMLSVGGLAAGMAHEINNPLAGMVQTANVMASRLGNNTNIPANHKAAEQAGTTMDVIHKYMAARDIPRMIDNINESGKRVSEIVDNMLNFARKSETSTSSHKPVDLMDKILELAATDYDLKKQHDFKSINIVKEYEDNLPLVPCEGAKIQQVLLNILRNGAQAMQEAKEKNSEFNPTFVLRLLKDANTDMLQIEIEDNGPGMDEETRKRVFEPFFTTKAVGIGTGLGLSVSYFIITENHKGTMDVKSEPGMGTTFIIQLPLHK